jgi:zinc transport system ATP-binding protein
MLRVSDLSVSSNRYPVIESVSFEVKRATTLAIVGPNGAGKTTLFRALLNLVPYSGKIEWGSKVRIGYVPQNLFVADIPISVREFLTFKCKTDFRDCLASAGLETEVLEKPLSVLSGGEMQRVLVAWAIVDKPNVLLFDEPTANVDIGSEELIYETLNRIEKELGMTILLISHNIYVVRTYTDNVLALNKNLIYYGESRNLSDPNLLMKIYGSETILTEHRHQQRSR